MTRRNLKLLAVLTAVVCASFAAASPAGAWFHSVNGKPSGTVIKGGITSIKILPGGFKVVCDVVGFQEYTIEEFTKKLGKQPSTLFGPHLQLSTGKWEKCKVEPFELKFEVKVVGLSFQFEQPEKSVKVGTGTVSVSSEGVIEGMGCVIKIPVTEANEFLGKASFKDSGTKAVAIEPSVSGITTVVATSPACESLGLKSNKEGGFSMSEPLVAEGVTLG